MGFRDEVVSKYTDEDGLILERPNSSPGPETGNGLHGLAVYHTILHLRRESNHFDVGSVGRIIKSCEVGKDPLTYQGLFHRGPRKTEELIAHDDYIAIVSISSTYGLGFTRLICRYGRENYWSFDNLNPRKFSLRAWHGRHPGLVAFYRLCNYENLLGFGPLALSARIAANAHDDNPGGKILTWLMIKAVHYSSTTVQQACDYWWDKLRQKRSDGMRSVFAQYYGPQHPFALYSPE